MALKLRQTWGQFHLRTLLILVTLIALAILPVRNLIKSRWRFQHYQRPDLLRQRSQQWLKENPPARSSGATMLSQESDLPSP